MVPVYKPRLGMTDTETGKEGRELFIDGYKSNKHELAIKQTLQVFCLFVCLHECLMLLDTNANNRLTSLYWYWYTEQFC